MRRYYFYLSAPDQDFQDPIGNDLRDVSEGQARAMLLPDRVMIFSGFADQAHLNRWFRRYYGVTPGAYQAAVRSAGTAGERDRRYSQEIPSSIR